MSEDSFERIMPWPEQNRTMGVCPDVHCQAEMMQPVWWERAEPTTGDNRAWLVQLYCGECQTFFQGVFDVCSVEEFDTIIDTNARKMQSELARIGNEGMKDLVDKFTSALHAGAIYPEDF